jgi:hypothetical protein
MELLKNLVARAQRAQPAPRVVHVKHVQPAPLVVHVKHVQPAPQAVYLNCGYAIPRSNSVNHYDYFATKKEDIECKIIPFFEKYTLQGNKLKDFRDFKKAVELKCNYTLTPEIFTEIVQIKQGMNKNRLPENNDAPHEKTSLDSNLSSTTELTLTKKKSVGSCYATKRHYSSAIIREKQSKFDQIKYLE